MQELSTEYATLASGAFVVILLAHLSLLITWPFFLLIEKLAPVRERPPNSNYWLNWKVTFSNVLLAPVFAALIALFTISVARWIGLPSLQLSTVELSVGLPVVDLLLQGAVIFFTACFLGDLWYYWWHRMQHKIPMLWELHKLHHSDENLNATTIYRSHFLEPAGQALVRGLTIGLVFDVTQAPQTVLAVVAGGFLLALWDYFIHANVRIDCLHRLLPFFSTPQYHWIHHSKLPQHRDTNFSIWLPIFDMAFGSYYHPAVDEYPPTGLSSGEKIESLWQAQTGPLLAWARGLKNLLTRREKEPGN
jgi:sterol desaturase/sphingolipid hydroxylase (fatty acid hydroxylase superfamily)